MSIEAGFESFKARTVHPNADEESVRQLRMAFFAGAFWLRHLLLTKSPSLDGVQGEFEKFYKELGS